MKHIYKLLFLGLLFFSAELLQAQLIGSKTIPSATYPSLKIAIDSINIYGVGAAGVTFNVTAGHAENGRTTGLIAVLNNTGSSNSIVFQKSGVGANPIITAGIGVSAALDGIIRIEGTDNVTIDGLEIRDTSINNTTTLQPEYGIITFKKSATDGCQNIIIRNCTITLNKTNTTTIGIAAANTTSAGATNIPTNAAYISSGYKIYSNTISNCYNAISLIGSTTASFNDNNNDIGTLGGNIISNFGGGATQVNVINISNTNNIVIRNNSISGGTGSTGSVYGILVGSAAGVGLVGSSAIINSNSLTMTSSATSSAFTGISFRGTTGTSSVVNIDSNSLTSFTFPNQTSATFNLINTTAHPFTLTCNNNTLTDMKAGSATATATGTFAAISITTSNTNAGSTTTIRGNTISGFLRKQSVLAAGIFNGIGLFGSGLKVNIFNNRISNDSNPSIGTTTADMLGITITSLITTSRNIYNNSITGFCRSLASTGTNLAGIYISAGASTCVDSIYSNVIANWTNMGTASNTSGIYNSSSSIYNYIYSDSVYNLIGKAAVNGILVTSTTLNNSGIVRKNYINISDSGTTGLISGIAITSNLGTTSSYTLDSNYCSVIYPTATSGALNCYSMAFLPYTVNINNNTTGTIALGSTSSLTTGSFNFISLLSASNTNVGSVTNIFNNSLTGFVRKQSSITTGAFFGINIAFSGLNLNVYKNIIENDTNPSTSDMIGINITTTTPTKKNIYNNSIKGFVRSLTSTGTNFAGIFISTGSATAVDSIYNNVIANWSNPGSATNTFGIYNASPSLSNYFYKDSIYNITGKAAMTGILFSSATANNSGIVRNNYINIVDSGTTSLASGMAITTNAGTSNTLKVDSNSISILYPTATSGTMNGISVTTHPYNLQINNNNFGTMALGSTISVGTGAFNFISLLTTSNSNAGSSTNIYNNNLSNFVRKQSTLGTGIFNAINVAVSGLTVNIYNNIISNDTNPSSGTLTSDIVTGINVASTAVTSKNIYNNSITGIYRSSISTGSVLAGIYTAGAAATCRDSIVNNVIANWNNIGAPTNTYGIFNSSAAVNNYIYNDSIYNITPKAAATGIFISGATPNNSGTIRKNYVNISDSGTTSLISGFSITASATSATNSFAIDSNYISINYPTATTGTMNGILLLTHPFTANINNNSFGSMYLGSGVSTATGAFNFISVTGTNANLGSTTNIFNHTLYNFKRTQSASGAGNASGITTSGGGLSLNIYNNIISNDTNNGTGDFNGILVSNTISTQRRIYNNQISSIQRSLVASSTYGIQVSAGPAAGNDSIYNNVIKNWGTLGTSGSIGILHSTAANVANTYIYNDSIYNIDFNGTSTGIQKLTTGNNNATIRKNYIAVRSVATNSQLAGITFSGALATSVYNIDSNYLSTIYNTNTSGNSYIILNQTGMPYTTNIVANTIANGTVGNGLSTATGEYRGVYIQTSNTNPGSICSIFGNTIANFTRTQSVAGAGIYYGISCSAASGAIVDNIYNNVISDVSNNSTSSATYGIYFPSTLASCTNRNIYGNIVSNISRGSSSTGNTAGIYIDASGALANDNIYSNVVKNISVTGTSSVYGIYHSPTATLTRSIYNDSIYNLSSGGIVVSGIYASGACPNGNIYNNIIADITSNNTLPTVTGIYTGIAALQNISNNRIGRLFAPNGSNTTLSIAGIHVLSGTNVRVNYNTIRVNAVSSGADFGTTGIYSATTGSLDLRNNLVVNTSTPSGLGMTAAFRRSVVSLATYRDSSDNNLLFAGIPSTTNLLYTDGTNNIQNITDLKTYMRTSTGFNRDRFTQTEDVSFLDTVITSTDFLRVNPAVPSYTEGGGQEINYITIDDIDGSGVRSFLPDIGADEYIGIPVSSMLYSSNLVTTASNAFTTRATRGVELLGIKVTSIGDYDPIKLTKLSLNIAGSTLLTDIDSTVIYYTGNSSTFDTLNRITSGVPSTPMYELPSDFKVQNGDNYFWLCYHISDIATLGDVVDAGVDSLAFDGTSIYVNASPVGDRLIVGPLCGIYTVGNSGLYDFATITEAISAINLRGIDTGCTSNVIFELMDSLYSASETFPLTVQEIDNASSGGRSIIMRPATGVNATISDSSMNSLFILAGTDYFTIDGSNNGSDSRNLTFINIQDDQTTTQSYDVIRLVSLGVGAGATHDTIKNCIVQSFAGMPTVSGSLSTFGITIGGSLTQTAVSGIDNDFDAIINNAINKVHYGIYCTGSLTSRNDNLYIAKNVVGSDIGSEVVSRLGIFVNYASEAIITRNTIKNLRQYNWVITPIGMNISTGVVNSRLSENLLHGFGYNSPNNNTMGSCGILLNTGSSPAFDTIANNVMYDLSGTGGTTSGSGISGIQVSQLQTDIAIYNNTIALNTNVGKASGSADTSACIWINNVTDSLLDIRNNILYTTLNNTANAGARSYCLIMRGTPTRLEPTTNNNLYYASGAQNFLGVLYGSAYSSLGAWQTGLGGGRESAAVMGDPTFNSFTNYTPLYGSIAANAGTPIATLPADFEGLTRSITTPTIGAYETVRDVTPPDITYTPIVNISTTGNRTLTNYLSVTDANSNPVKNVYMFYKKTTDDNIYVGNTVADNGWKYVQGTGTSPFSFVIDTAIIYGGTFNVGDEIQYFFVAEDSITVPYANVGISSGTFNATPDSSLHTTAMFPLTGTINSYFISNPISGILVVDSAGPIKNLTGSQGLFKYINENILAGDVTVEVASDLVEPGTYSLNSLSCIGGTYTLRIVPQTAILKTITGNVANAMIRFYGTDNVSIDGSFSGSGRYFTFRNYNINNSVFAYTNDCNSDSISSSIIEGANINNSPGVSGTTNANGLIFIGNGLSTGNDNLTFNNNLIGNIDTSNYPTVAIYCEGNGSFLNDQIQITNNEIYNFRDYGFFAFGNYNGINCNISGNHIYNALSSIVTSQFPIRYEAGASGGKIIVENNYIGGSLAFCGGPAWMNACPNGTFNAIRLSVGSTDTSLINGNIIRNFNFSSSSIGVQFIAINVPSSGLYKIGTNAGNYVGDSTFVGSITHAGTNSVFGILNQSASSSEVANNYITSYTNTNSSGGSFTGIDLRNGNYYCHDNVVGCLSAKNMITNVGVGALTGIALASLTGDQNLYNNKVRGLNAGYTSGTIIGINVSGPGSNIYIHDNVVGSESDTGAITQSGSSTFSGITCSSAATSNIYSNVISGIVKSSVGSGDFYGIQLSGLAVGGNVYSNTIGSTTLSSAILMSGTGTFYGIGQTSGSNVNPAFIRNNTISNIYQSSTGTSTLHGIYSVISASATSENSIDSNLIQSFTLSGTNTFNGVTANAGIPASLGLKVRKNTIKGITFYHPTATGNFTGFNHTTTSGIDLLLSDNIIGDTATNSSIVMNDCGTFNGLNHSITMDSVIITGNVFGGIRINDIAGSTIHGYYSNADIISYYLDSLNMFGNPDRDSNIYVAGPSTVTGFNMTFFGSMGYKLYNNTFGGFLMNAGVGVGSITGYSLTSATNLLSRHEFGYNVMRNIKSSHNANTTGMNISGADAINNYIFGNEISNIQLTSTSTGTFTGIAALGNWNFMKTDSTSGNNIIGSITDSANISTSMNGATKGIVYTSTGGANKYIGNTVGGISALSTGSSTQLIGHDINLTNATNPYIGNNHVKGLRSSGTDISAFTLGGALSGFLITSAANTIIEGNSVHEIIFNNTTSSPVAGFVLYEPGDSSVVRKNHICAMKSQGTSELTGIYYNTAADYTSQISNNGISVENSGNTNDIPMSGFYDEHNTAGVLNLLYNSIVVGGSQTSGASDSRAIHHENNAGAINIINNIFYNKRTGGSGVHLSQNHPGGISSAVINYNLNVTPDTNYVAKVSSTSYKFSPWRGLNRDSSSWYAIDGLEIYTDSLFTDLANGNFNILTTANDGWYAKGKGIAGIRSGSISSDLYSGTRSTIYGFGTDIGASEFNPLLPPPNCTQTGNLAVGDSTIYTFGGKTIAQLNWVSGTPPTAMSVRYYSGDNPPDSTNNGGNPGAQYTNFYTLMTNTGGSGFVYNVKVHYDDALVGNIQDETLLKVAKAPENMVGQWKVHVTSNVNAVSNIISMSGFTSFSAFAGSNMVSPLPMKLLSFQATSQKANVLLSWQTATEQSSSHFNIMRSIGGGSFVKIGQVKAVGNSIAPTDYHFLDSNVIEQSKGQPVNYQLEMIDIDGTISLSDIRTIYFTRGIAVTFIYPQPTRDDLYINMEVLADTKVNIGLFDLNGKSLINNNADYTKGTSTIHLNLHDLSQGIYLLKIENDGDTFIRKIMKL